jgi:hypothetical protein
MYAARNPGMIMSSELGRMWKEAVMASFLRY